MSIKEKVSFLKGLAQGMEISEQTKEGKLLVAMIDVLDEIAISISDIEEVCNEFDEMLDIMDEDLSELETDYYDLDDEGEGGCGCGGGCGCHGDDGDDEEDHIYEVFCPSCEEHIYVDEDMLLEGDIECPECGECLEFDLSGCMEDDGIELE